MPKRKSKSNAEQRYLTGLELKPVVKQKPPKIKTERFSRKDFKITDDFLTMHQLYRMKKTSLKQAAKNLNITVYAFEEQIKIYESQGEINKNE